VATQVLVRQGADLNRVRQQVIQLLHGYQGKEPVSARSAERELMLDTRKTRLEAVEQRLTAIDGSVANAELIDECYRRAGLSPRGTSHRHV
jgi:hypothetical protein